MNDYLEHSKGPWKKHKYISVSNGKYVYKNTKEIEDTYRWNANKEKARVYTPDTKNQDAAERRWKENKEKAKTSTANTNPSTWASKINKGKLWLRSKLLNAAKKLTD